MNEALIVVVRGLIGFFTLLIYTRILGKQQISQLTFFDYIVGITIGSAAASLTIDLSIRAFPQWVGISTWAGLSFLMHIIALKSRPAAKYIEGEPVVVIMNGKIMEDALRTLRFRVDDLRNLLRAQSVFDIAEVEFAVLEPNGQLSILKKTQYQPVTPNDLNIPTQYKGISTEIIYDGQVIEENLIRFNLDQTWLLSQLAKLEIKNPSEVMLATLDTQGNLYVDKYQDRVKVPIDISDYHGPN